MSEPTPRFWEVFFGVYEPMQRRIGELRGKYTDDVEALTVLDQLAKEPEMHRRNSDYYAYEFFVVRRPNNAEGLKG
jgi:hypothetical protein